MKQAKDSLTSRQIINLNSFTVRATHLYVKFNPADEVQMDVLEQDSTLDISSVPKDYLIAVEGSWYREPNLPDSVPSPQYASVGINYNFPPNINYQILDSLYVPDEDSVLLGANPTAASMHYADMLIHKAFLSIPEPFPTELIPVPGHIDD